MNSRHCPCCEKMLAELNALKMAHAELFDAAEHFLKKSESGYFTRRAAIEECVRTVEQSNGYIQALDAIRALKGKP